MIGQDTVTQEKFMRMMERVDVRIGALVFVDDMAVWGNFCCDYLIKSEESWRNVRNHTARTRSH